MKSLLPSLTTNLATFNMFLPSVCGRELHTALEVATPYHKWVRRTLESLSLEEGVDYERKTGEPERTYTDNSGHNSKRGRPATQFTFSPIASIHIGMAQRNHKGKAVRDHFILIALQKDQEQANLIARVEALEKTRVLPPRTVRINPKSNYLTVGMWASRQGYDLTNSERIRIGKMLARYCREKEIKVRQFENRFGTMTNRYPRRVLRRMFEICVEGL